MQPRRFGLLLPLARAFLALALGCSHQPAKPASQSTREAIGPEQIVATTAVRPADVLQRVESVPILQPTPHEPLSADSTSEIVQTRYRPISADPPASLETNPIAQIEFGRAPDYGWLQGELLFSSVRGVWRLRYAAADDEDLYGGSVTLVDVDSKLALQAGQRIRVKGRLINPRSNEPSPFYHVLELKKQ